jgi:two-component system, cell cycle sensor histidine kinase and response regulator CckA
VASGVESKEPQVSSKAAPAPAVRRLLRVLVVEDSEDDAQLLLKALARAGYETQHQRVQSGEELRAALERPWDVVCSDFLVPGFGGMDALKVVQELGRDLPFVIVSGTVGEETAVEALKAGAHDFLVKGRLTRLGAVIERELRDARLRRQQKAAEQALRESEALHRTLFECCPLPILICEDGGEGAIVDANPAAVALYGHTRRELVTLNLSEIVAADSAPEPPDALAPALCHRKKDGTLIEVELMGFPLELASARFRVWFVTDVTEKRRFQQQLRQAQKLETLGRLAGGVAHDFNNMLTPILIYSSMLNNEAERGTRAHHDLAQITKAAERAKALVGQLMSFSRHKLIQPRPLDLNGSVAAMENMLCRMLGEHIELVSSPGSELLPIFIDASEAEQVVVNLVLNARDAMPNGGRIRIATSMTTVDAELARAAAIEPGRYLVLSVSDSGTGMDERTAARIFEPFFTTKASGHGTGLGLATVRSIMSKNRGGVRLFTEVGAGTTFELYFRPYLGEERPSPSGEYEFAPSQARGTETILLVEDDDLVRSSAQAILYRKGYTVIEARNGAEALDVARERGAELHLLLTDVVMPDQGGRELASRVSTLCPGVKVLFMSGHTDDSLLRREVLEEDVRFLPKPFTADALASKVREVLNQKSSA